MKNRILSFMISIALALGLTLSLSSCGGAFGAGAMLPGGMLGGGTTDGGDTSGGNSENNSTGNVSGGDIDDGDGGNTGNTGDEDEGDDKIEFIPGVSDEAAEADKLTSAPRALLSTVIVHSNFEVYNGYTYRTETVRGAGVIYTLDRAAGERGFCGVTNEYVIGSADLHMWEEPCISGTRGSGTVFFSNCNLKCIFCQNYLISQNGKGKEFSINDLVDIMKDLEKEIEIKLTFNKKDKIKQLFLNNSYVVFIHKLFQNKRV